MTPDIQPLPLDVIHLIAAGEVIDSPAAVVRELAENALDAGATRITVSLWPEQWRIRVADNGGGMDLVNLKQAAIAHSTSKIHQRDDLTRIRSLGFRGEALHSLAQLSQLEILSRAQDAGEGWCLRYSPEGEPLELETVAIAPGTVVTVSQLFGNWEVRRQGLPAWNQQMRAVQQIIYQLALCHPGVTWQIEQRDRPWFALWPGDTAQAIFPQILREVRPTDLQGLRLNLPPMDAESLSPESQILELVLGLPDRCHRHRPDWVRVAINGRCVQLPELEQTLMAGFRRTLPRDRHPLCFLHLRVSPEQVDWNRHPAKTEVYLHHLATWQERVREAIAQALNLGTPTYTEMLGSERVNKLLKVSEAAHPYQVSRTIQSDANATNAPTPLHALRAVAQVHQRYILAEHPMGMWLVEQHIAHERVLYEQLCDRWQLVDLETPAVLSHLSAAQIEQLQRLGLSVESFGDTLWAVRNAPEMLAKRSDCPEALMELSLGGDLQTAMVATACRSAIRNGTPLTLTEMQTLLDQWQVTRQPRTCPHGRPIYLPLEESSLARFFRRHWVIGKSHGI